MRKATARILIAALLLAVAGPALADSKSKQSGEVTVAKKQKAKKGKSTRSGQHCKRVVPPFMRNPRYMNRGFFKCRNQ